jgi:hypothetical protein
VTIATGVVSNPNPQQQEPSAPESQIAGEKGNFGEEG